MISGCNATIGGGYCNFAASCNSTVSGGYCNTSSGYNSTVGGGGFNIAGSRAFIGGGCCNSASGYRSAILGGHFNDTCSHSDSFIIGSNICAGAACYTFVNNLSSQDVISAKRYETPPFVYGNASGTITPSYVDGGIQKMTVTANLTVNPPSSPVESGKIEFWLTASSTYTIDLPATIKRPSDSAITFPKSLSAAKMYIMGMKYDGSSWLLTTFIGGY